jgi:hypothetical protein
MSFLSFQINDTVFSPKGIEFIIKDTDGLRYLLKTYRGKSIFEGKALYVAPRWKVNTKFVNKRPLGSTNPSGFETDSELELEYDLKKVHGYDYILPGGEIEKRVKETEESTLSAQRISITNEKNVAHVSAKDVDLCATQLSALSARLVPLQREIDSIVDVLQKLTLEARASQAQNK